MRRQQGPAAPHPATAGAIVARAQWRPAPGAPQRRSGGSGSRPVTFSELLTKDWSRPFGEEAMTRGTTFLTICQGRVRRRPTASGRGAGRGPSVRLRGG